jgi:ribosomal protein L19E
MELPAKKHPEMRPLAADCQRMTLLERFRKRAEAREKDRRGGAGIRQGKGPGGSPRRVGQVITEKDREIQELRRKLREAGIDS